MQVVEKISRIFGFERTSNPAMSKTIILSDQEREFRVDLTPGLPDDAYQQLFTLDLSSLPPGALSWDHRRRSWCPVG